MDPLLYISTTFLFDNKTVGANWIKLLRGKIKQQKIPFSSQETEGAQANHPF
jgi:hypothetical protein